MPSSTLASATTEVGLKAFWLRLQRGILTRLGLGIIAIVVLTGVLAPYLAPYDPARQDFLDILQGPSRKHLLGTDDLGRDILSRVIHGARISLQVGVVAVGLALAAGVVLGLLSGYVGGAVDNWLMRLMDALLAFPIVVLALAIAAMLGPSLSNIVLAIGVVGVPTYARLVRGQVLSVQEWEFVQAARGIGSSDRRILFVHILPNITAPIIVQASLHIATAILTEAGLSFLGLGVHPPSWGAMLNVGRGYLEIAPWMAIAPGAAIFLTVLGFNFVGDGLRDALDPRLKQAD
jgi:peptide/nickel transport system permease protein